MPACWFKTLDMIDDVPKKSLTAVIEAWLSSHRFARELMTLIEQRERPSVDVSDGGTGFNSNAILEGADKTHLKWHSIASRKSMQNGGCEVVNVQMRDELLNETPFFGI